MLRIALLLASSLATGVSLGRTALVTEVDKRKQALIAQSAATARIQIKQQAGQYLARASQRVITNTILKIAFIAALWLARDYALLPQDLFFIAATSGLAVFLAIDIIRTLPTARAVWAALRDHGWHPKRALSEIVAANVFDKVMAEATDYPLGRTQRLLLAVAGTKQNALASEVANAVADISRTTTWKDLQPFLIWTGINFVTFSAFYSAFLTLAFAG